MTTTTTRRTWLPTRRRVLATVLALTLIGGVLTIVIRPATNPRTHLTAYFDNSNGVFANDDVRILGVTVGKIERIDPQPQQVKISFWVDAKYRVPADAKAVILSPSLVTARAIQLTPAYHAGPLLGDHAVIPRDRTAVPVEYDDFRQQLKKLTDTLQPTQPGGVSTLGSLINTAADNLRGQGAHMRDTVIQLSQTLSALGDHRADIFGTVKNLAMLASALQDSTEQMMQLNKNLAQVSGLIANDPNEIGQALDDFSAAVGDVKTFLAEHRDALGTTTDRLASITTELTNHLDDLKQVLHVTPTTLSNFVNIYHPAQAALAGALAINQFANPITFVCGAIQAASRLGAEQAAKLCVQYLAPIIKNRQYNFPPIGLNPFVGPIARPNEVTYSQDSLRPDYIPPQPAPNPPAPQAPPPAQALPAEAQPTNPADGLRGLMMPPEGGS
ncbi:MULTISPECIES: MCE family protein [Mycobacterium simiae complex]|uniref:Virulence factor Mce family protein n=2 Tax=Mycobacterium simiae complex TaxID=2249310 RepID=A0A024K696_9MYCO|nr:MULTISPECIES: MCE family protein [Mycobacterium simiae complex]ORJ64733.1 mammalian cell entry protein [Mycobacterium simiae]CDO91575.1 virulence factor Mce family protein [Mycobacterium triplex]